MAPPRRVPREFPKRLLDTRAQTLAGRTSWPKIESAAAGVAPERSQSRAVPSTSARICRARGSVSVKLADAACRVAQVVPR